MSAQEATRSRRSILAGVAGGLVGIFAGALGRPPGASATHGDVHLEASDSSTTVTTIETTAGRHTFAGVGTSGTAVYGSATTGTGIRGHATAAIGMFGSSSSTIHAAVYGVSYGNRTGLRGASGGLPGGELASAAKTGVHGYAAQDTSARGVTGQTTVGRGVNGVATSGVGVYASADATGTALQAAGRVAFSTAGLTSISVGTKARTIAPGTALAVASRILCTLESNEGGLFIHRLTKDVAADTFKVILSANVASGNYANVAWFVID